MSYWNLIVVLALALSVGTATYIRVRWQRAPVAFKAMRLIAASYFLAGSLAGLWIAHIVGGLSRPSAAKSVSQPTTLSPEAEVPGTLVPIGCGSDRWPVKTLSDLDANRVNWTPVRTTISALVNTPGPPGVAFSYDHRIAPVELTTYVVSALVVKFKVETDHDTHVIVVDPKDFTKSMVTEFVDWNCAGAFSSKARDQFKQAYADLLAVFGEDIADSPKVILNGINFVLADLLGFRASAIDPKTGEVIFRPKTGTPPTQLLRYATVEITGIGYWDEEHGVEGSAPNNIELHPVLGIRRNVP